MSLTKVGNSSSTVACSLLRWHREEETYTGRSNQSNENACKYSMQFVFFSVFFQMADIQLATSLLCSL